MKLKLPKIKIPKIQLSVLLWAAFLIVVLIEAYVLYQSLYVGARLASEEAAVGQPEITRVDFEAYEETVEWLLEKEDYSIPNYTLSGQIFGRENPFAEY